MSELGKPKEMPRQGIDRDTIGHGAWSLKPAFAAGLALLVLVSVMLVLTGCIPTA